jgi:23S rRNA pseudouridine2605 synthase
VARTNRLRQVGLARALSKLGHCSRSEAVDLIQAGRVRLNGVIRRDPEAHVDLEAARVEVNGQPVATAAKVYLALNKPRGTVTTASDEKGRQTVYAFLDSTLPWVAPVGRLDKASEGLLLLTNDSEWAAQLLSPASHLDKTYHVQIDQVAGPTLLEAMGKGVRTVEGDFLRVSGVRILRGGQRNTWLEIVLDEGKNRHIRRMLAALGVAVLRLVRVAIGPLPLGQLAKGRVRPLRGEEKQALDQAMRDQALRVQVRPARSTSRRR